MFADYGYIGIFLVVAILFAVIIPIIPLILTHFGIVPKKSSPEKSSPYECGMDTIGKTHIQFNFRYYFFAVIFVALDVLTIFLYPWAINLKESGPFGFIVIAIFFLIILVGYVYAWRKGALEWK